MGKAMKIAIVDDEKEFVALSFSHTIVITARCKTKKKTISEK